MDDWGNQIEQNIQQRKLFGRGEPILAAVSGGLDSMVLLHLLHRFSKSHGWKIAIAHFNHQLRGRNSDADERLVRKAAVQLKLEFFCERADIKAFAKSHKFSIEMSARKLRHEFLARTAKERGIRSIALAHHADDQVELFFLRLFRGSGMDGLAGMKWKSPSPANDTVHLIRPLLDQSKESLIAYANIERIPFREDASNASLDFQRNRIRHELIPLLKKHYQPALARTTLRVMEIIGGEAEFTNATASNWLIKERAASFPKLPVSIQRRVLRLQLLKQNISGEFELIESLRRNPGAFINLDEILSVRCDATGKLHFRKNRNIAQKLISATRRFQLAGHKGIISFDRLKIDWSILTKPGSRILHEPDCESFDADKVGPNVCLRYWKPGDRFQQIGMPVAVKLQDIFTNRKIPQAERHNKVVAVTERGELFWVEGLRMAECFKLDKGTSRRLKWRWKSS